MTLSSVAHFPGETHCRYALHCLSTTHMFRWGPEYHEYTRHLREINLKESTEPDNTSQCQGGRQQIILANDHYLGPPSATSSYYPAAATHTPSHHLPSTTTPPTKMVGRRSIQLASRIAKQRAYPLHQQQVSGTGSPAVVNVSTRAAATFGERRDARSLASGAELRVRASRELGPLVRPVNAVSVCVRACLATLVRHLALLSVVWCVWR